MLLLEFSAQPSFLIAEHSKLDLKLRYLACFAQNKG
jgi:hypothetical protein